MTKRTAGPQGLATPQDVAATSGDVAGPSLLSRGAPPPGTPPSEPWFKNDEKLLAEVIERAGLDRAFALRVMHHVGALAKSNPRWKAELDASARAAKPGATTVPNWLLAMLLDSYESMRARGLAASAEDAHERLAAMCRTLDRPMSATRVRDLLTRARKQRGAAPSA